MNPIAPHYTINVVDDSAGRRGKIALMLSGPDLAPDMARVRIWRRGYKKPFLHAEGWTVADSWLEIQAIPGDVGGAIKIPLAPGIAYHLEENSNYSIAIALANIPLIERPIRWSMAPQRRLARPVVSNIAVAPARPVPEAQAVPSSTAVQSSLDAERAWVVARELDSREAYQSFLDTYPLSEHLPHARAAIDALENFARIAAQERAEEGAWVVARQDGSKQALTQYLLAYPDGRFIELAKAALAAFLPARVVVRSGWTSTPLTQGYGVDTTAFLLGSTGVVRGERDMVSGWVTNQESGRVLDVSGCGAVRHSGPTVDVATGVNHEAIEIDLSLIDADIQTIVITINLDNRIVQDVGLEAVPTMLELLDALDNEALVTSVVDRSGGKGTSVLELRRAGMDWVCSMRNDMFEDGILDICRRFGVATA